MEVAVNHQPHLVQLFLEKLIRISTQIHQMSLLYQNIKLKLDKLLLILDLHSQNHYITNIEKDLNSQRSNHLQSLI